MGYETIRFEVEDGVARLTLNRPERLNSFTAQMHGEFAAALSEVEEDAAIRCLLLTGAGQQQAADRRVLLDLAKRRGELAMHLRSEAVEPLGTVERQPSDSVFDLEPDRLVTHLLVPLVN